MRRAETRFPPQGVPFSLIVTIRDPEGVAPVFQQRTSASGYWIRTRLGGPRAPFGVDESVPLLVDVLLARLGKVGLAFVDRDGNMVPW